MSPEPCDFISGTTRFVMSTRPKTLVSNILFISSMSRAPISALVSVRGVVDETSTHSSSPGTPSTVLALSSPTDTSLEVHRSVFRATVSISCSLRPVKTTWWPALHASSTMAAPIPGCHR